MKKFLFYFISVYMVCASYKPLNKSIGMKEAYKYPNASSFKLKTLASLNTMLQKPAQYFTYIQIQLFMEKRALLFLFSPLV